MIAMIAMFVICGVLVLVQVVFAKVLCDLVGERVPRWCQWLVVLVCYGLMSLVCAGEGGFLRMVLLCSVLLGGMKWVVYCEWRNEGGEALGWARWFCFGLMWFGMEPRAWVGERRKLAWVDDAKVGGVCVLVGVLAVFLMGRFGVDDLVLLFVGMSVGFHFGVLRLLTAFWRWRGFPVRALFRNPLVMRGFGDFWGGRWNLAYSQMMARCVKRPLRRLVGERGAVFGVFLVSGLLHELAITVPVGAGYGGPTLFFVVQSLLTIFERREGWVNGVFCGVMLVVWIPILFPDEFKREVIYPVRDVFELRESGDACGARQNFSELTECLGFGVDVKNAIGESVSGKLR